MNSEGVEHYSIMFHYANAPVNKSSVRIKGDSHDT